MRKIEFQDTFTMARILEKANLIEEIAAAYKKGNKEGMSENEIGIDIIFSIVKAAGIKGIDEEVYNFLGDMTGLGAEKIRHQGMKETIEQIKEIARENDIKSFLASVQALMK